MFPGLRSSIGCSGDGRLQGDEWIKLKVRLELAGSWMELKAALMHAFLGSLGGARASSNPQAGLASRTFFGAQARRPS